MIAMVLVKVVLVLMVMLEVAWVKGSIPVVACQPDHLRRKIQRMPSESCQRQNRLTNLFFEVQLF